MTAIRAQQQRWQWHENKEHIDNTDHLQHHHQQDHLPPPLPLSKRERESTLSNIYSRPCSIMPFKPPGMTAESLHVWGSPSWPVMKRWRFGRKLPLPLPMLAKGRRWSMICCLSASFRNASGQCARGLWLLGASAQRNHIQTDWFLGASLVLLWIASPTLPLALSLLLVLGKQDVWLSCMSCWTAPGQA